MQRKIQWKLPFACEYGDGMVHRLFSTGTRVFGVGFEYIETMQDFSRKGVDILSVNPVFRYPINGVWTVIFDEVELDPVTRNVADFKGFKHIVHPGLSGGRVLFNIASIIFEHYTACQAGAYVFSAANDRDNSRRADLTTIYDGLLGLNGAEKSKLFYEYFAGWEAFSNTSKGGRSYVVTTQRY